jgi:hypothetical protein
MSLASLVTLAQLAAVGRDTYSWRVGFDTWYPLGCFKSLRRLLEPARPDTAPIVRSPTLRRVTSQSRASAGAAA